MKNSSDQWVRLFHLSGFLKVNLQTNQPLHFPIWIWFLIAFIGVSFTPIIGPAQPKEALKIGVYDSRVIVMAYSRSDYFSKYMKDIGQKSDSAKKANDSVRIKELSIHAMSFQHLLHQMVFGSGTAAWVMDMVKDKLPAVAEKAGVSIIVSKFELTWHRPGIELVDLSQQIADLFQPKENLERMVHDIWKHDPIPLQDLSIEYQMLDSYCVRFGKK